jgi:glycosyltransferase involved in cell wall biosynthesis
MQTQAHRQQALDRPVRSAMVERLLYFCPVSSGGIADYAHAQATSLAAQSVKVTLLCASNWPHPQNTAYQQLRELPVLGQANKLPRWISRLRFVRHLLTSYFRLRRIIVREEFQRVLLASYIEYLAPVWAPRLRSLSRSGVVFGAIVHDPVRDHVVGPSWWHRWSIVEGYSFLREAFVHADIDLGMNRHHPDLRTTVIPHGPYDFPEPTKSRRDIRDELSLPQDSVVLLSFGNIRDAKNLDRVLQAMVDFNSIFLIVAGSESISGQKSSSYYQELAKRLGIANRCRWLTKFIEPNMAANLFAGADFALVTYSSSFRSASGVMNIAARYRKPVLASSGASALRAAVERYELGVFVEPDSASAIAGGLTTLLRACPVGDWDAYLRDNSWVTNARQVMNAMDLARFSVRLPLY